MCGCDASQRIALFATLFAVARHSPLAETLRNARAGLCASRKKRHTEAAKLRAVAMLWADAVTETHKIVRPFIDPSKLGSDPDSWLLPRFLRAQDRWHTNEQRLGSRATNGRR